MAGYALIGSYSTVQVLSPTVTNDIEYCTIQTDTSGVVASAPVQRSVFQNNQGASELTNFADAIEQVMQDSRVIAGVGSQQINAAGTLDDFVTFTIEYASSSATSGAVTTTIDIPIGELNFTDGQIGTTLLGNVEDAINAAYDNLQSLAGG